MIEKGVLHLDQNEFMGENGKRNKKDRKKRKKRERKRKKGGGKEVQLLLVSSVRTARGSKGREAS